MGCILDKMGWHSYVSKVCSEIMCVTCNLQACSEHYIRECLTLLNHSWVRVDACSNIECEYMYMNLASSQQWYRGRAWLTWYVRWLHVSTYIHLHVYMYTCTHVGTISLFTCMYGLYLVAHTYTSNKSSQLVCSPSHLWFVVLPASHLASSRVTYRSRAYTCTHTSTLRTWVLVPARHMCTHARDYRTSTHLLIRESLTGWCNLTCELHVCTCVCKGTRS